MVELNQAAISPIQNPTMNNVFFFGIVGFLEINKKFREYKNQITKQKYRHA